MTKHSTLRLGILKLNLAGAGCFGLLAILAAIYVLSVLWWSFWLWEGVHWGGAETWSYWYTCTHWGALTPFVVG